MYRYNVDNTVTYTPDDIVLFRESPFAIWMERLTLENPDHGILPDIHITQPKDTQESQEHIVATLRAEGRNVALVDRDMDESDRRTATMAAMRAGADFIVNGQLAVGTLSGGVNLLMRTSGYSQLGDFLYVPCETQASTDLQSAFRLSFFADLLQSLQGQLPPQMLIIRDGVDVVPLQTEDYIYYYRAFP
jgi:predicted RecB family nuclease